MLIREWPMQPTQGPAHHTHVAPVDPVDRHLHQAPERQRSPPFLACFAFRSKSDFGPLATYQDLTASYLADR